MVCLILTLPGKVEPAFKLFFFLHLSPSVLIGSAAGGALGLIVGAMYAMVVGLGSALDWIARRWAERPSR